MTTRDQWHITLQFLGNRADLDAVASALDGLDVAGGAARVGGAGAFPDARRGRVLWLGLVDGAALATRLAAAVVERTETLGHEREARPFRPHVTLARGRVASDLRNAIAAIGDDPVGPSWRVDAVTVYESRTHRDGARYLP